MFKRKKELPPSYLPRLDGIERSVLLLMRDVDLLRQKISLIKTVENDLKSVDVLTTMMSEVVRRIDLAGVADLPSTCVCESCGCKNDSNA